MRDEIYWVVTAALRPEDYDAFTEAITPLVATTRDELGSDAYDYSASSDRTVVHIYESYRDSAAVVTHVEDTGRIWGARARKRRLTLATVRRRITWSTAVSVLTTRSAKRPDQTS